MGCWKIGIGSPRGGISGEGGEGGQPRGGGGWRQALGGCIFFYRLLFPVCGRFLLGPDSPPAPSGPITVVRHKHLW